MIKVFAAFFIFLSSADAVAGPLSVNPDTPFKLATFETAGTIRLGMVFGARVVDLDAANAYVARKSHLSVVKLPREMRELIEQYSDISPRLYPNCEFPEERRRHAATYCSRLT